jgi:hypothetical protein
MARLHSVRINICPLQRLIDDRPNSMESLRVLPPVPLTLRVANKTGYVGDILVPKGTEVMIPVCLSI